MCNRLPSKYYISFVVIFIFFTNKIYSNVSLDKTPVITESKNKNLVGTNNSQISILTVPDCTKLSIPLAGNTNVTLGIDLSWHPVSTATGYRLTVGTISGGYDILNDFNVGFSSSYNLPEYLPKNSTIYVKIIPYNLNGDAISCTEESFKTKESVIIPECTNLRFPLDGATNVPVDTNLSWNPVFNITGYIITLETFTTGTEVLNRIDVGNTNTYIIPADLPENTIIYVIITPYNLDGEGLDCIEETFTTGEEGIHIPPKFFTPNNDSINDYWIVPNPINNVADVFIYDRYGKLLKHIVNLPKGWDGTINGSAMPANDYWYHIIYKNNKELKGHFSLVR
ncbi:T9SS type B sorting domain-containing protein [Algibacter mikhailovii]|uniref:T9SS type B sorting domain-containing protein n=1 Tax=Algibacter mikhailovii TaxID=425498 RepID=UPI00249488F2|nr:T9SS type B sorting domain-containing protein [Algibacter mikhailovii]